MTDHEPCPNCGEPGRDSQCLLIETGAPGRDRRRALEEARGALMPEDADPPQDV